MKMLIMIELMFLKELILISDMKQVHQKRVVFFTIGITDDLEISSDVNFSDKKYSYEESSD